MNGGKLGEKSKKKMDIPKYIEIFKKAESHLDHKLLKKKQMESAVGIYGNSVFLKLFKNENGSQYY